MVARVRLELARDQTPPLFLGYLLLQAFVVVGLSTPRYPDSETYMHLSFRGSDLRLPTVPLLYKILPSDSLRIAGQVLLAASAWWLLAAVASRMIADRRVAIGLQLVLLMLGLVAPIASWNSVILSESAAISLTALVVAGWLAYVNQPQARTAGGAIAATLFWTFARQPDVFFGLMITAAAIVALVVRADRRRLRAWVAFALVAISAAGLYEIHHNQVLSKNTLAYMIQSRILPTPSRSEWFRRHGMPNPRFDSTQPARAAPTNLAFITWVDVHGLSTYARFILTHPDYMLLGPLPFFSGEESSLHHPNLAIEPSLQPNPTPSMLSPTVDYGRHRDVLPSVVQGLLFEQGQIGDLVVLALLGATLAWAGWKRFGRDRRYLVPSLVAISAIPQGYVVWLSGGEATHELDRLSMVTAVSIRIGLWIVLAIAIDRLAVRRVR